MSCKHRSLFLICHATLKFMLLVTGFYLILIRELVWIPKCMRLNGIFQKFLYRFKLKFTKNYELKKLFVYVSMVFIVQELCIHNHYLNLFPI